MSGAQIGSAIGFVAGFFLPGGPAVWSAIGGAIGGWISPTQVNGPRIGDGQSQSSAEGMPIPWILGTGPSPIQGQIVQKSPRREIKKTDDGKGSGTEVNTYEAHQDFCILICESSEHRGSLMVGVLMCLVDGKIVYDMRPESNFAVENAKFLDHHTFYNGNEAQMPDPTMEALVGVDFAMYYRGVFTMVGRDINLSAYGDRIPVYQYVMVGAGESVNDTTDNYETFSYGEFVDAAFPLGSPESKYLISDVTRQDSGTITGPFDTIADAMAAVSAYEVFGEGFQYLAYTQDTESFSTVLPQASIVDNDKIQLMYGEIVPQYWMDAPYSDQAAVEAIYSAHPAAGTVYADEDGFAFQLYLYPGPTVLPHMQSTVYPNFLGSGNTWEAQLILPTRVLVTRIPIAPEYVYGDPCLLGEPVLLPDAPGFIIDCAGNRSAISTFSTPPVGTYAILREEQRASIPGGSGWETITEYAQGPILAVGDPNNTQAFWEAAATAAGIPGSWPVDFPGLVGKDEIWLATSTINSLETQTLGLDTVTTAICLRGGLSEADIDVADMDQQVMGYGILQPYTATEALSPLMQAFLSYGSEYDAQLHFHKHGEDVEIVIDPEDFIEGSDETDENTRDQQIDYPRQLSIVAIDATQNYTARPQVARRTSPDIRAIGEEAIEVAVVLPPDYHAQLADIGLKVLWARAQGPRKFTVPFAQADTYLKLVPGMPFALDGKRWMVDKQRIGNGEIEIEAVYDRQSAYTSDVQETPALPPTPPPSNIGGVTLSAILNLPVLRDQDDVVGLYFAISGLLPSWPGCYLQVSQDDQVSWQTAIASMTQSSVIGYLTAPLQLAPASGDDVTNTLSVSVHGGELNSITRLQYLNEGNPCAIVKVGNTGECEVLGFQDADEITAGDYDLTTLVRGGLSTGPAAHAAGARFVGLDSVYFWQVPSAWIGKTLWFRPVTLGTAPDNNVAYSIVFNPAVNQTEWPLTYLTGRYTGSAFVASVTPRHRLGNDLTPIQSANFIGYRWTLDDGDPTHAQDFTTTDPSAVFELSTFDSPATVTVAQLNRFTGPGPSLSITI